MPTASDPAALALSGRIPELDGVRGIAIAMVLLFHLVSLGLLLLSCRLSWVYLEKPRVKLGHRFSYHFRETLPLSTSSAKASLP